MDRRYRALSSAEDLRFRNAINAPRLRLAENRRFCCFFLKTSARSWRACYAILKGKLSESKSLGRCSRHDGAIAVTRQRGLFRWDCAEDLRHDSLNRWGRIPSRFIFDSSVCLGVPRISAAPCAPDTLPEASRKAVSIIALSRTSISEPKVARRGATLGLSVPNQLASTEKMSPSQSMTETALREASGRVSGAQGAA